MGEVGALLVLDCIASGCLWIDMKALGVDVVITAPQKGWSAPAGVGVAMLGERAVERLATTTSSSFVLDLKKWIAIMDAYHNPPPGHAYHATLPTDTILITWRQLKTQGVDSPRLLRLRWSRGKRFEQCCSLRALRVWRPRGLLPQLLLLSTHQIQQ